MVELGNFLEEHKGEDLRVSWEYDRFADSYNIAMYLGSECVRRSYDRDYLMALPFFPVRSVLDSMYKEFEQKGD